MQLRKMEPSDRAEVAELICVSTNNWYQARGGGPIFPDGPLATAAFFDVYEALDPGYNVVAQCKQSGRLMGSCFFHPRPTHISLGILNVHPDHFGQGVARTILQHIIDIADHEEKPLRLVSSAMNLDSYSLYTRAGFVPRETYQDMMLAVSDDGFPHSPPGMENIREATSADVESMSRLEMDLVGIHRDKDFKFFIENADGQWHVSIYENSHGTIDGFMASSTHSGCNMIGPGAAKTPQQAAALVAAELDRHRGRSPVMLVPVNRPTLVKQMYDWGAKNCEMHFSQVRGQAHSVDGIFMPTFLPESA
ncbi:MAG: GNAT family N-acetyltransferase [Planctomycetota bacterium]|nr:GNAT family N-acetyltransferase [Planctomycetota bacterium]